MKRSGLIFSHLARQSRNQRRRETPPDAPIPTLPPEKFRFSRVKDNPLKAIVQRFALATILILAISLITWIGRAGYIDNESTAPLSFIDSLYFATVSVTTTGYGDIVPVSTTAKLVNIFIVTPARILFIILLVGTTLQVLAERSRFIYKLKTWQKKLDGHLVVCGFGVKGRSALEYLRHYSPDMEVVAIDDRSDALEAANAMGVTGILGDAFDPEILKAAEIGRAKTVVVSLDSDDHTVLTILRVRELNSKVKIVASCREQSNGELITSSGADEVIVSSSSAGRLLGMAAEAPDAAEVMNDLLTFGAGLDIDEWTVTEAGDDPETDPEDTVIAIIRDGNVIRPSEPGCLPTQVGDRVVYVTRRTNGEKPNSDPSGETGGPVSPAA
jgi:voltage-gated potassium channel